jgi:hypothetical protein
VKFVSILGVKKGYRVEKGPNENLIVLKMTLRIPMSPKAIMTKCLVCSMKPNFAHGLCNEMNIF